MGEFKSTFVKWSLSLVWNEIESFWMLLGKFPLLPKDSSESMLVECLTICCKGISTPLLASKLSWSKTTGLGFGFLGGLLRNSCKYSGLAWINKPIPPIPIKIITNGSKVEKLESVFISGNWIQLII